MKPVSFFKNKMSSLASPLLKSMMESSAGMKAQADRLLVISQNLANAGTKAPSPGVKPYQRKRVSFISELDKKSGVHLVKSTLIEPDASPFPRTYDPGDPGADKDGFVEESNVKPMTELTDMREAARSHEANLRAYEKAMAMLQDTIGLLKS
ncbi:MAG TPA: flagellar basal body rod protein FlgC [Alphaproteobacteria bacterium]|nr:flagellar basal body rod protein FlgC [Alphaproteobacteria bacterium]